MINPNPLVSVIIPTRDRAHFIEKALNSVFQQNYEPIEIIVVDDGSKDNTGEVLDKYLGFIKVLRTEGVGAGGARNHGFSESKGELIAFLDSDDYWLANKLRKQVELICNSLDIAMVVCGEMVENELGFIIHKYTGPEILSFDQLMNRCASLSGGTSGVLIRRKIFEEMGGFDSKLLSSEDWDLFLKISTQHKIATIQEYGIVRLEHCQGRSEATRSMAYLYANIVIDRHARSYHQKIKSLSITNFDYAINSIKNKYYSRGLFLFAKSYLKFPLPLAHRKPWEFSKLLVEAMLGESNYSKISILLKWFIRR